MNWADYRFLLVPCVFTPRDVYKGRPRKPGLQEHTGACVRLMAMWLMDEDDRYPGEWALSGTTTSADHFGLHWIASGDVTPVDVHQLDLEL